MKKYNIGQLVQKRVESTPKTTYKIVELYGQKALLTTVYGFNAGDYIESLNQLELYVKD